MLTVISCQTLRNVGKDNNSYDFCAGAAAEARRVYLPWATEGRVNSGRFAHGHRVACRGLSGALTSVETELQEFSEMCVLQFSMEGASLSRDSKSRHPASKSTIAYERAAVAAMSDISDGFKATLLKVRFSSLPVPYEWLCGRKDMGRSLKGSSRALVRLRAVT